VRVRPALNKKELHRQPRGTLPSHLGVSAIQRLGLSFTTRRLLAETKAGAEE